VVKSLRVSVRRACRVIGQHRSTQKKPPLGRQDEAVLTQAIIRLGKEYGRYGYRRITAMLRAEGWSVNVKTLYIAPGSPWENGYCESFNSKLRDEFLDREVLYTLKEAKVLIEAWRRHYNTIRPHSSLGYRPPAPEALLPAPITPDYVQSVPA